MPADALPLFRPDVLRPRIAAYPLPQASAAWQNTLSRWAALLASAHGQKMKESELLPDFISEVFIGILGYTPASAPDATGRHTLTREKLVQVGGKFADGVLGSFAPGGERVMVAVEGKGPLDPLERPFAGRALSAVDQGYGYAINLPCDWIIVTNLRQVRLYHKGHTQRTYERFDVGEMAADPRELRRFVFLLGAERIVPAEGDCHLYALLDASEKAGEEVTQAFYAEYARMRRQLFAALREDNPAVPPRAVLGATQKVLDRILFIAFAEDRGLLPENTLAGAYAAQNLYAGPQPIWNNFQGLFRAIDVGSERLKIPRYNGGLFAPDAELDALLVRDEVCADFRKLGAYDYRAPDAVAGAGDDQGTLVDVEVLGHIFEQSITDLEQMQAALDGGGQAGPAVTKRKREGAFYTPAFVTRYIVGEALRPVLAARFGRFREERRAASTGTAVRVLDDPRVYDVERLNEPQRQALVVFWEGWLAELQTVRIADPACGSGAFLIEAFDQLFAVYQEAVEHLTLLEAGQQRVFDPDRAILQHNLYGVDLNEEAIEIARLSIWIKTAQRGKVLTDLDHNVRHGNSVVHDPAVHPRAFGWQEAFPEVFAHGGFDVVIGNPPYVRAELITAYKPYFSSRYRTYHGSADLYTYFYELGMELLRPGGRLSYIVTNKWLKSGYGEPLRAYFAREAVLEQIIDFGHAPIFPDADVFPMILIAAKPQVGDARAPDASTRVAVFPREELASVQISDFLRERAYAVPPNRFAGEPWSLEHPGAEALLTKIRAVGTPLSVAAEVLSYRGVVTGANEVFLIKAELRNRLIQEDPRSAEIIRPYLRGREIERWRPNWAGEYMIFTRRGVDLGRYSAVKRYLEEHRAQLEPKPRGWQSGEWAGRKEGSYLWYEIQDAVDYWQMFSQPKICYPDIAWASEFALDTGGFVGNNSVYFLPTDSRWLLGVLNSHVLWYFMWKTAVHGKDEVLRLFSDLIRGLPMPPQSDEHCSMVEPRVEQLIAITRSRQEGTALLLDWLAMGFEIEKPSQKLQAPHLLEPDAWVAEVKKAARPRRPERGRAKAAARRVRGDHSPPRGPEARGRRPGARDQRRRERRVRPHAGGR